MESKGGRQTWTLALVLGAMVLGMFLAGGVTLAPLSNAQPAAGAGTPVAVALSPGSLPSFADLAEAVSPAVVSIQATTIERGGGPQMQGTDPFEFFFGPRRRTPDPRDPRGGEPEERRRDATGSGFVISADGYVVTNHHVIEDATGLTVELNGRHYPAEVKGDDPATDLALLKISAGSDLPYLAMADSDEVRVGDWVMVIGSPLQLANSVSVGVVSAKGRSINITSDRSLENFIQTDAAINFGNSGGPLVNLRGEVIGIATAINFGAENIGFAVPSNTLGNILPQLRESGRVQRGYLGVNIADLDYDTAQAFGLPSPDGALVTQILDDSPSAEAGLRHGDIILEADGRKIHNNRELIDYISGHKPGDSVELLVFRNGEQLTKTVKLGERPGTEGILEAPEEEAEGGIEWLGIRYQELSEAARSAHGIPEDLTGVWITDVSPSSPLWDDNVRPNDIISDVNGTAIASASEFEEAIEKVAAGGYLRLYITRFDPRSGQTASFFAVVPVPASE